MPAAILACALAFAITGAPARALAEPKGGTAEAAPAPPSAPPSTADTDRDRVALESFREGVSAARAGDWARAYELFHRASELSPRPVVLFNLAGAEVQTGRLLAAEASYRRFLAEPQDPSPTSAERRRAAEAVLRDLEERVPRVRFEAKGLEAGDRLELDDRALNWPAESEVRVDLGPHRLRVIRGGLPLHTEEFEVAEFEVRTVSWVAPLAVKPPGAKAGAASGALTAEASTPPEPPPRSLLRSPWLWIALGAIAAGAGATAFALSSRSREPFVGNVGSGVVEVR